MKSYQRRSPEQWKALVADQLAGELSAPEYCKRHDVAYASFSKWRTKLKQTDKLDEPENASTFVELTVPGQAIESKTQWQIELDLAPGVQLRIAR